MRPIILIGAARSGTKLMRDSLAIVTGVGVVPYDVNFVWRYRNESRPDDAIPATAFTPRSRTFIRNYLSRYEREGVVIEKTVSNSLRIPFVDQIVPEASYVHLIRDGVDTVESTFQQWQLPSESRYLREKVRHFPVRLAPTYGRKYVVSRAQRRLGREERVGSWGVRYPGIDIDLRSVDLLTVCARQWRTCVEHAVDTFAATRVDVHEVRYEDFVREPVETLHQVSSALSLPFDAGSAQECAAGITDRNVGKGRGRLSDEQCATLATEIDPALTRLGYAPLSRVENSP